MKDGVRTGELTELVAGTRIPFGGSRWVEIDADTASRFRPGDRMIVIQEDGSLVHVPRSVAVTVDETVSRARTAFEAMGFIEQDRVTHFFDRFAGFLANDEMFAPIAAANEADVERARSSGRATGRLALSTRMRADMIEALELWREMAPSGSVTPIETVRHDNWSVDVLKAPLGVVGFVFEGRPNVFADATGVLRGGNVAVMRIGSDALGTAKAIMEHALRPALVSAGLPVGCVELVEEAERSAGHALFSDRRLALAVARGSGRAVAQLGAVARQSGIAVSLHGTGGAWMLIDDGVSSERVRGCVEASLDRKVCNTVNVVVLIGRSSEIDEAVTEGVSQAARRLGVTARLHVVDRAIDVNPTESLDVVHEGDSTILATEWEWDVSPEMSVVRVGSVDEAIALFNAHSPRFIVSAIVESSEIEDRIYRGCDAPFVGDGFTRWVDGQYALRRPELGLSNWESGRLFARGSILSGDGVHTVRYRAHTPDPTQRR
jgi:glutamate-5-semialdehyde dehydrogenase